MSNEEDKFREERDYFIKFAAASGINIEPETIEKLNPPKNPDIKCLVAGEVRYFEMARMCSQDWAKQVSKAKEDAIWVEDPVAKTLSNKLACIYEVEGDIDLVLYDVGLIALPPDVVVPKLKYEIENSNLVTFKNIWYFAEETVFRVQ